MSATDILTQSQSQAYNNCRRYAYYRYEQEIVPIEKNEALAFGTIMHQLLAEWHKGRELAIMPAVSKLIPDPFNNERRAVVYCKARAMICAYVERYQSEPYEFIAIEHHFQDSPILNPKTGSSTPTFKLAGKIDGIAITKNDEAYIVEHKTTSKIDGGYLERLWCDWQIMLYARQIENDLGLKIEGVLYNILVKPQLRKFQESKKSPQGETWEDYYTRCLAKLLEDREAFHREIVFFTEDQYRVLEQELWETQKNYQASRLSGEWRQNRTFCWHWNKPCAYWKLCLSGDNPVVRDNLFTHSLAHKELEPEEMEPVF